MEAGTPAPSSSMVARGVAALTFAVALVCVPAAMGATSGASMVKDVNPGDTFPPTELAALGDAVLYRAYDGEDIELWRSNGTPEGTFELKNIAADPPGVPPKSSIPTGLTEMGGFVYFQANTPDETGSELWRSDGTEAGTVLVKDINTAFVGAAHSYPTNLTDVNGTLFFAAKGGPSFFGDHWDLWLSDGTEAGTVLIKDLDSPNPPEHLTNVNGTLYFTLADGATGTELWVSDGTTGGTKIVKDIAPGVGSSNPGSLTDFNGMLIFAADDGINGRELWRSVDGTAGNTTIVKNIDPDPGDSSNPDQFEKLPGVGLNPDRLLFGAESNGDFTRGIWETDGTEPNTRLVKTIRDPAELTEIDGTIFFQGFDGPQNTTPGTHSQELWKTDGTEGGTVLVKDINDGFGSFPQLLTELNGTLYFQANDGIHGMELWRSDGTGAGTVMAADIKSGAGDGAPTRLTAAGSLLFFSADDGQNGREVWRAPAETTPPQTTIDSGPANGSTTSDETATFTFSSSEESTFECRTDGGIFSACVSPQTVGPLAVGEHTFEVRATDVVGNIDPTPASRTFVREAGASPSPVPPPQTPPTDSTTPDGPAADTKRPALKLKSAKPRKLAKPVKLKVTCDEDCSVAIKGTAKLKGKSGSTTKRAKKLKLKTVRAELSAQTTTKLKLKPAKRLKRKLKAARRATVKIRATATDAAGNKTMATAKVKLR